MKKVVFSILLFSLLTVSRGVLAQQDAIYTQYMFNQLFINPGYTGTHDVMEFTALSRWQWVGFEGAPNTQTFSMHTPLRNEKLGAGFAIANDRIGIHNDLSVAATFAYKLKVSETANLSFGMQAGFSNRRSRYAELDNLSSTNTIIGGIGNISVLSPNIGAGFYYYTRKYYIGLSVPKLLQGTLNSRIEEGFEKKRHYFLSGGYVFDVNPNLKLKPNILVKAVAGAPVQMDLNLNALLSEVVWVGVSYRQGDRFKPESLHAILEVILNEQWRIGYAYELPLTEIRKVTHGSHEFMLNYSLSFNRDRIVTPRYF